MLERDEQALKRLSARLSVKRTSDGLIASLSEVVENKGKTDILKGGWPDGQKTPEIQHPGSVRTQGFSNDVFPLNFKWLFDPLRDFTFLCANEP